MFCCNAYAAFMYTFTHLQVLIKSQLIELHASDFKILVYLYGIWAAYPADYIAPIAIISNNSLDRSRRIRQI